MADHLSLAHTPADGSQEVPSRTKTPKGVHTPGILYEFQNKRLTKFAIRKLLILKDTVCLLQRANNSQKKQERQQGCRTPNYYLLISIFGK